MPFDRFLSRILALAPLTVLLAPVAAAKVNHPLIQLEFVPQQAVAAVTATIAPALRERPIDLRVVDGRSVEDAESIGTRTDDDDKVHPLTAGGDVASFVEGVVRRLAEQWGLRVESGADLMLEASLRGFEIIETNQAVGATFRAAVRFELQLLERSGRSLWSGSAVGDATRYGKKFSNRNCNEVLSDALLESWAAALSRVRLGPAVEDAPTLAGDGETPAARSPSDNGPLAPVALLEEIRALLARGLESGTVADYVRGKTLTRRLEADELVAWKEAGIPEEVIRATLNCPVQ